MNDTPNTPTARPAWADPDKPGAEIEQPPAEVAKFAPAKYRTRTTLGQMQGDMRTLVTDMQRAQEEHARQQQRANDEHAKQMKQYWDELLSILG